MFRNLIILIAVISLFFIIKGMMRRSTKQPSHNTKIKDMVQCEQCKSYLPTEDAIIKGNKTFCNQQHLHDWEAKA